MAAGQTYVPIATQTLGSAVATVTFSSIPSSYTDLVLISNAASTGTSIYNTYVQFNADTSGTSYSSTVLEGNGTAALSTKYTNRAWIYVDAYGTLTNSFSNNAILNVQNYANTSTYKTLIGRTNRASGTNAETVAVVGLWRSTAAISTLLYTVDSSTFAIGSTFTLYGIAAA